MPQQDRFRMLYLQIAESIATPIRAGTLGLGGIWDDTRRRALRRVAPLAATLQQRSGVAAH